MPKSKAGPTQDVDKDTRKRLTDLGHIKKGDKINGVFTFVKNGLFHEVVTFRSGQRLITVSNAPLEP